LSSSLEAPCCQELDEHIEAQKMRFSAFHHLQPFTAHSEPRTRSLTAPLEAPNRLSEAPIFSLEAPCSHVFSLEAPCPRHWKPLVFRSWTSTSKRRRCGSRRSIAPAPRSAASATASASGCEPFLRISEVEPRLLGFGVYRYGIGVRYRGPSLIRNRTPP